MKINPYKIIYLFLFISIIGCNTITENKSSRIDYPHSVIIINEEEISGLDW